MSSPPKAANTPLDLSKWRSVPAKLMIVGGLLAVLGFVITLSQGHIERFAYSWLLAFMFFLSLCLGALWLVILHHLFDAGWSVPIRPVFEHISALLFPSVAPLFLPH